ncbi:uncharacterized protein LOC122855904 isoform X2 [Aphidius gifuensis]|uniref:uncharacterized protein LOC122855904 isoform X2 n=1 Tax=Aphidius gifuensis TaxID=684658 RepID=UPI001CDD5B0C|nr:uncharacterized protein LOC122855904 isoform X2 [Aphidius gifuensis]
MEHHRKILRHSFFVEKATLLESSPLRPRSVIAQGFTPAPNDRVFNDDKTKRLRNRRSLGLSNITRKDGIAKCMKLNTQIKKNIKNAILLDSSPLRPRSVIAQGSIPAPIDDFVNDELIKRSRSRASLKVFNKTRTIMTMPQTRDDIVEPIKLSTQNEMNIKNPTLLESSPLRPLRSRTTLIRLKQRRLTMQQITDENAESMKPSTRNEINIKNTTLLESSPLRSRLAIAQRSTPAPTYDVVITKRSKSSRPLKLLKKQLKDDHAELRKLINEQIEKNISLTQMIMERVNDDCLAEIFMYVPACERLKIALVCKKWKRALDYSWFNVTKLELTYWRYHELPNCLKKYQRRDKRLNFLKSLLDKCGRYLTILDLTAYDLCNIVPIINDYCPNLEKLRLRFSFILHGTLLSNAFTRLSKLKSLTIIFENMKNQIIPETLINSLINVAGTLTELYLLHFVNHLDESCRYPKNLRCVIRRLKALKRFEVAGIRGFKDSFKYLKNNEMSFYYNHNEYLKKRPYLGISFINISSLNLTSCFKDDTLYTIANTMEQLKILAINCTEITDDGVVALSKMNNLQIICLNGHSNITDSSIKLLKNILQLSLPRSNKITDVSVTKLLENSPKIEKLLLHFTISVTANFVKKAAEISSQRKQLLKISIHTLIPDVKRYESPYFKIYILENEEK